MEAESIAKTTTELATSGNGYLAHPIAYLPLDMKAPVTEFHEFKSREEAYQKLEGLVTDSSSSILGIYGIPGTGKTRLMERITTEVGKKGTFDKVVRANVRNAKLDVIGIQQQLAGKLGCDFESETDVERRAGQLRSSLRQGGKVLVILDDLWSEIPLDRIGILSEDGMSSKGGKILLTSRSEEDICKRCGGLPLVVLAIGKALKFKRLASWMDALNQLKNSNIEEVPGIGKEEYACLELSFDNLEHDDAKKCLLLASMCPEDADIPTRMVVQLARGSQLVKGDEIKLRVHSMISILQSASLSLQGKDGDHIKLHDIIRDMARSIAKKHHGFLFARSRSLPNDSAEYSGLKVLHLDVEETHSRFPSDVECPDLHLHCHYIHHHLHILTQHRCRYS
nr:PREDICTED: probable disease resistance protein At5g43740 [Daucus carota subsp. sativus]